jgi:hypothetical protein
MRIIYHDALKVIMDEVWFDDARIWTNHPIEEIADDAQYDALIATLGVRKREAADEDALKAANAPTENANQGRGNNGRGDRAERGRQGGQGEMGVSLMSRSLNAIR